MTQATPPNPPKLLDQVRDRLRVKHYSLRTEKQYLNWIRRFILFHGKHHPKEMGATEVEAFLTHLAVGTLALRHRNAPNRNETFAGKRECRICRGWALRNTT